MNEQEETTTGLATPTRTSGFRVPAVFGYESFIGMDGTVLEFWQWAVSDLKTNTTRSMLAEFLVAKAVGGKANKRVE
jgi:hypothetical protein